MSSTPRLRDFRVLTFDCYGTLIDWESGIAGALMPRLADEGVHVGRDGLLAAFSRHESRCQEATPGKRYPDILAEVCRAIWHDFGLNASDATAHAFGASVPDWPPFPDSVEALAYLGQHYQLVILSNVDRSSFARSNEKLQVTFDAVFTAEDVGSYKPDDRNFEYMLKHLADRGFGRDDILHTAESLHHDHVPAKRFGLASCWIHRRAKEGGFGATRPVEVEVTPDFRFTSMAAMAAAHRAEVGA